MTGGSLELRTWGQKAAGWLMGGGGWCGEDRSFVVVLFSQTPVIKRFIIVHPPVIP